ncbi:MAG: hypothetical protein FWD11_04885 [Micrococcales bacterium]|nr:hypothetical protein [Micrococcales bacterium]
MSVSGEYSITMVPGEYTATFSDWGVIFGSRPAGALTVAAGQAQVFDIALAGSAQVSGQVVSTSGSPIPNVEGRTDPFFSDLDLAGREWAGDTDSNGRFVTWRAIDVGETAVIGVNRNSGQSLYTGRYYAGAGNLGSATRSGAVPVTTTATTELGQTVLDSCATVSGQVSDLDARLAREGVDVLKVVVFDDNNPDLVTRTGFVGSDGSYRVTGLLPGSYYVALGSFNDWEKAGTGVGYGLVVQEFLDGVSPNEGAPNLTVGGCTAVTGVDFTTPGDPNEPPPAVDPRESDLVAAAAGKITVPNTAVAGSTVRVRVGAEYAGQDVYAYLFSDPVYLGGYTVSDRGTIDVTLPPGVTGAHRIAVYALSGVLIGWDSITITAPAKKGIKDRLAGVGGSVLPPTLVEARNRLAATGAAVLPWFAGVVVLLSAGFALTALHYRRRATV